MSNITDFVASCREIANGQVSPETSANLRTATEQTMPRQYHIPFPTAFGDPVTSGSGALAEHTRGLYHELAQHLTDLRYLSEADFVAYRQHHAKILDHPVYLQTVLVAVRSYVAEEDWSEVNLPVPAPGVDLLWLHENLAAVTERISVYLTWDGSLSFSAGFPDALPACYNRSLAYRLRTLSTPGLAFPEGADAYTSELQPLLQRFATDGLGLKPGKRGLAGSRILPIALTDINELLRRRAKHSRQLKEPLLYQISPAGEEDAETDFSTAELEIPDPPVNYFNQSKARRLLRKAERWEGRRDNDLSTRLLQLKLWQINFYVGEIDGDWDEKSHRALLGFISEQSEIERGRGELGTFNLRQRNVHTLLLPVNREQGIYLADFTSLSKELSDILLVDEAVAADQEEKLFSELGNELIAPEGALDEKVLAEANVSGLYPAWRENHRRRIAYTRKGFLGRILRGVGRVIRWLKGVVSDALEEVGGVVFGLVKMLLGRVRTGIQRFFAGFRYLATFLLGKPLLTVMPPNDAGEEIVFATSFKLDFDAVNVFPSGYSPGDPARHGAHLDRMMRDMDYFIQSAIDLVKIIGRLSNPGGWVWLGWQIGRAVVRLLVKRQPEVAD